MQRYRVREMLGRRHVTAGCAVTTHDVDLLVVGAGPVGLYGAYYAGVRGLHTAVIDSLDRTRRANHRDVPGEADL